MATEDLDPHPTMPRFPMPPVRNRAVKIAAPLAAVASLAVVPAGAQADSCVAAASNPAVASIARANNATVCLINRVRRHHHLRPLRESRKLSRAARRHSRSMVAHRYFDHGDYLGRIRKTGYFSGARSWTAAENIAWGSGRYATPISIFRLWMHSSGHRRNILNPRFREIGIGIHRGAPESGAGAAATYTTDFGARH
jgi:uncharacterized protein YkwD